MTLSHYFSLGGSFIPDYYCLGTGGFQYVIADGKELEESVLYCHIDNSYCVPLTNSFGQVYLSAL